MRSISLFFAALFLMTAGGFAQRADNATSDAPSAAFGNQITFTGGATGVRFSSGFLGAAASLGLTVSPISAAGVRGGANVSFPITWGTVDGATLRGEIMHSRFLQFEKGSAAVKIEGFIIDTTGPQPLINGLASANGSVIGRIPLFDLDLSNATISQAGSVLQISGVRITLRSEAAGALNSVFSTNAFVEGFDIGTATVSGLVAP
ncbi:MAG TPA: hypothetical protein PKD26_00325 [Pyrinomonadaceae bacterium]|nr:hypothetical protein [Pyrinomonadaceae bacterium]